MLKLILQRLAQMVLIMAIVSLILFAVFDSEKFKKQLAVNELGGFAVETLSQSDYQSWLEKKGLNVPFYARYAKWVVGIFERRSRQVVPEECASKPTARPRAPETGKLAFWVFALMIPLALVTGVVAGIREGKFQDRAVSFISVLFTSIPEIATAIILTVIFALGLGWLPVKSKGVGLEYMVLPVADPGPLRLRLCGAHDARLGRRGHDVAICPHSGAEGHSLSPRDPAHVLRNALIAPFTVIVLQLNWLLSGVVVVEVFFQYDGFGKLLLEAALFGDLYVIQAATLAAVLVAVVSQLISDIGYTFLNPRIRFS